MEETSQVKVKFTNTNASILIDLVRGLAAILVLLEHWRNMLYVDFNQLTMHRSWLAAFYLLGSAGHQAVVIFFVLSGFLISRSVFTMLAKDTWGWSKYLVHRLVRLWVVLLPGLLLCALWDQIGLHAQLAPALYGGADYNHITPAVATTHTLPLFFSNLFFLQIVKTPVFGSNGALWSLAYEFWYYMLFPLGLLAVHRKTNTGMRLLYGVFFFLLIWFLPISITSYFPIWLVGTGLALMPAPQLGGRIRLLATCLYIPLFFLLAKIHALSQITGDYILGVATFFFLWTLLSAKSEARSSLGAAFSREVSRFSYTLYVVHMPFMLLLVALLVGDGRWVPSPWHLLTGIALFAIILMYAYGVAFLTEFNTDRWRRWVERKLNITRHDTSLAVSRT